MNNYQLIENSIACVKDACEEIHARGVRPDRILSALLKATSGKNPLNYDVSTVNEILNTYSKEYDFLDDVIRYIRRHLQSIPAIQQLLEEERDYICDIIGNVVDPGTREEIAVKLLANGMKVERD